MTEDRALSLPIKELPTDERPREKLWTKGAESLSNAELLAILLRTGTPQGSAVRLAEQLLVRYGGLAGLSAIAPVELSKVKGIGPAKAVSIAAAVALSQRLSSLNAAERPIIRSPQDAAELVMARLRYASKEYFMAVLLSTKNHVLALPVVSVGSLNASIVHPRELFREAIFHSAASVILVHNHPSGDPTPSQEDIQLTHKLVAAGRLLDISVLDHMIIGDGKYVSLKEKGII
jgi:DNA repair protein RadC